MSHSIGQRLSRCLLTVLAIASLLLALGGEGKLARVIDLNLSHKKAVSGSLEEPKPLVVGAEAMPLLEPMHRLVFSATRLDRLQRANAGRTRPSQISDILSLRLLTTQDSLPRTKSVASTADRIAAQLDADDQPSNVNTPQPSGFVQVAERDLVFGKSELEKSHHFDPQRVPVQVPRRSIPLVTKATRSPIETWQTKVGIEAPIEALVPTLKARPVVQFADAETLLSVLQPPPSASDLPALMEESPRTDEQVAEEDIKAFELDVKPIHELSVCIRPEAGELPRDYATARFAREGEVAHQMGYSRSKIETVMTWEAPALCHRPLYFEDINLERHGYKVPLIQPALSAAHFFGRVPLLPYMMVSERHGNCQYTLGHYRPGDYAPYSLYVPRLRLDASAAEAAVVAGVLFAFP